MNKRLFDAGKKRLIFFVALSFCSLFSNGQSLEKLMDAADKKLKVDDYKGAITDLSKILEINPKFTAAYFSRGFAKAQLGDYKGAIEDETKAIKLEKNLWMAYMVRGDCRSKLGNYKEGLKDLDKTIQLNPNNIDAYITRAIIRIKAGDKNGACDDLAIAKSLGSKEAERQLKTYCVHKK
jgi:tetratricopeptide (TPR) repeat protein